MNRAPTNSKTTKLALASCYPYRMMDDGPIELTQPSKNQYASNENVSTCIRKHAICTTVCTQWTNRSFKSFVENGLFASHTYSIIALIDNCNSHLSPYPLTHIYLFLFSLSKFLISKKIKRKKQKLQMFDPPWLLIYNMNKEFLLS